MSHGRNLTAQLSTYADQLKKMKALEESLMQQRDELNKKRELQKELKKQEQNILVKQANVQVDKAHEELRNTLVLYDYLPVPVSGVLTTLFYGRNHLKHSGVRLEKINEKLNILFAEKLKMEQAENTLDENVNQINLQIAELLAEQAKLTKLKLELESKLAIQPEKVEQPAFQMRKSM